MASGKFEIPKWKNVHAVTFPFTPETDGILYVNINPTSSSSDGLYYIAEDASSFLFCVAKNGVRDMRCAPATAGKTYSVSYSANIASIVIRFYGL